MKVRKINRQKAKDYKRRTWRVQKDFLRLMRLFDLEPNNRALRELIARQSIILDDYGPPDTN